MKTKRITYFYFIVKNMKARITRYLLLLFFIFSLVTTVIICTNLSLGVKRGIDSTISRMGADIILVPDGFVSSIQDALFLGAPCTVYFKDSWIDRIKEYEEVEFITSQLFLATITDSACCDSAVQVIAFDPDSDFIIQPWINKQLKTTLKEYEIVIGSNLNYEVGDHAKFYGEIFKVAGKLEETGMGYDNSVFLNYTTAFELVKKPIVSSFFSIGDREDIASLISVKVKEGSDFKELADKLKESYEKEGIKVYTSGKLVQGLTDNVSKITTISYLLCGFLFLFTFVALISIFTLTINERRREYGILRSIGASPVQIIKFIAGEAGLISVVGSVAGCIFSFVILSLFHNYIVVSLKLPFLTPELKTTVFLVVGSIIVSLITDILASLYGAVKISQTQVYLLIKENE